MKNKIKEETIHLLEAIIYILLIIVVVIANFYGPIYMSMIPLLFLLGVIGKSLFNRPISTTVFGVITTICIAYMSGIKDIQTNLYFSFISGIAIFCGEVFEYFIKRIYTIFKEEKKIISKANIIHVIFFLFIIIGVIFVHNYINSNIFVLKKSEKRLNEYINLNYKEKEFKIVSQKYSFLDENNFKFVLKEKNTDETYNFIVYVDNNIIKDMHIDNEKSTDLQSSISKFEKYILEKKINEKYADLKIISKKNEKMELELNVEKNVTNIDKETILLFSRTIAELIIDIKEFEKYSDIVGIGITINSSKNTKDSKTSYINMNKYNSNLNSKLKKDYEFIQNTLEVEYIG